MTSQRMTRSVRVSLAVVCGALWASAVGRAAGSGTAESEIAQIEQQRFAAMQAADIATLDRLLSPDLTYTHSSGKLETKPVFLGAIQRGALKYKTVAPEGIAVRVYDSAAVVTGRCHFQVEADDRQLDLQVSFTDVYVKRDGAWQLVAWQSTRLPEP
jgi:ketosteroid isomerase-like protein